MTSILALTSQSRPLQLLQLTKGSKNLLLIGGVHGDETEGFYLVERFVESLLWKALEGRCSLFVLPRANPDGCELNTRGNAVGIDLNRNMPTKDWSPNIAKPRYHPGVTAGSEIETKTMVKLIEDLNPHGIISAHSWKPMINYNGPAKLWAEHMAKFNGYIISDDIGYPTPGSLGTWAGWERKIPTLTLEIEQELAPEKIWETHSVALLEALLFAAENEKLG